MKFMKVMSRIYDLPNAFRVLDIMDKAGCDIEQVEDLNDKWRIKPKWYVSEQEARDLQTIILFKAQYKHRSPVWEMMFRRFRGRSRVLHSWF